MNRSDEQRLILQAQRGNREAFATLYQATVQPVFRYIAYRVNDHYLAEDLTADVFTRALQGLATYQDRGLPFLAWLYRIAHARVVDYYRKQDRRPTETDIEAEVLPVDTHMDSSLIRQQAAQVLRQALTELTAEQQEVVILRFVEGHKLEIVAQLMGKNANAIKALQHRALKSLANRLQRAGIDVDTLLEGLDT